MIKVKDGYAKLIGTTYSGSVSRVLLSNGGDHILGNASSNIPLNNGTVNTNLNADMLDGLHIHAGRNNEANKIVRTDANGFLLAGWINTTSGNIGTGAINKIYCSDDNYIRYKTPANFFETLANDGNQISITVGSQNRKLTVGYTTNADKLDGYHASSLVKFYLSPMTNDAPADAAKSWFINTMPSGSGAIVYNVPGVEKTIIAGKSTGAYGHLLQLNYVDTYLRILRYYNGSWKSTDWEKIAAGYADSAGNADTVDGYHASTFVKIKLFRFSQYNQGTWTKILTITINSTADLLPVIAFSWLPSECSRTIWADFSINWRSNSPIFYAIWKGMDSRTLKVVNSSGAIWDVWVSGSKTSWDPFGEIQITYTHNIISYNGGNLGYSDTDPGGTTCITGGQVNYATSARNADTVDGYHASAFATAGHNHFDRLSSINIDTGLSHILNRHYEVNNAIGTLPFSSSWHQVYVMGGVDSGYTTQICTGLTENTSLYFRHRINKTWNSWRTILDSNNSNVSGGGSTWGSSITVNINGTSKTLTIPGNPNTDYRVTQSETTTANYRPLVLGYTNVSTAGSGMTGSVTNQVYLSNKFYVQPSTGNLYATTFVGALSGNATTASKWTSARTFTLTGSVTGNVSIDGSANVTLITTTNHTHNWTNIEGKPSTFTPSSHTHDDRYYTELEVNNLLSNKLNTSNFNWTNLSGKLVAGNEFNIVNTGFNSSMWFNHSPINDRSKTASINGYHFGNGAGGYTSIKASGFIKNGSNGNYVLLGDGGHKAISDFATTNHTHAYLPLSGGTMTGTINANDNTSNTGIKFKNNSANLNALSNLHLILSSAIRFGAYNTWDWNVWAGLKYDSSSKTIYLGLADGTIFNANSALSGGSLRFPGISNVYATTFNGSLSGNASTATNADKLDGYHASAFASSSHTHSYIIIPTCSSLDGNSNNFSVEYAGGGNSVATKPSGVDAFGVMRLRTASGWYGQILMSNTEGIYYRSANGLSSSVGWKKLLDSGNFGDYAAAKSHTHAISQITNLQTTLDGKAAASHTHSYLPLAGGTMTGTIKYGEKSYEIIRTGGDNTTYRGGLKYSWSGSTTIALWGKNSSTQFVWHAGTDFSSVDVNGTATRTYDFQVGRVNGTLEALIGGNKIWHAGNDGSGSGLDADKLDGYHASAFALSSHTHNYLPLSGGTMNANARISFNDDGALYIGREDNSEYVYFQDIASLDGTSYWNITQSGYATFKGTVTAPTFSGALSGNATTATTASKLGSSTVGSDTRHFYLNAGTATASRATVGGTAKPMYLKAGVMTALSVTVGSKTKPVYLSGGTIMACSSSLTDYLPLTGGSLSGDLYVTRDTNAFVWAKYSAKTAICMLASSSYVGFQCGNYAWNGNVPMYITGPGFTNGSTLYLKFSTVDASGNIYASHFYENSDIRYKKILRNLSINSNTIANLPLFDFEWIENNIIGTGTSALAVLQILPNLVSGTDKLTLDYGVLGTIAGITACKELVTLKSELLQLKEKVKLLEDKLRKYENI